MKVFKNTTKVYADIKKILANVLHWIDIGGIFIYRSKQHNEIVREFDVDFRKYFYVPIYASIVS